MREFIVAQGVQRVKGRMRLDLTYTIDLNEQLLAEVLTDEWREQMYKLYTPEDVAQHLVWNFVCSNASLNQLDGFADQPAERAKLTKIEWNFVEEE